MNTTPKNNVCQLILTRTLIASVVLTTLLILFWLLDLSFYGFDFLDESLFLTSMEKPFAHDFTYPATLFHFFYHPIYWIFDGHIVALRWFTVLSIFSLSWLLAAIYLKSIIPNSGIRNVTLHVIAAGLASVSIIGLMLDGALRPRVPFYNPLAFKALMVVAIGLLFANETATRKSIAGWIIIGIGGWLAVLAKASSAAVLAPLVLAYVISAHKNSLRMVLLAITTALSLYLITILFVSGSVPNYIERLRVGLELTEVLRAGHSLNNIFLINIFSNGALLEKYGILLVFLSLFVASNILTPRSKIGLIITGSFAFLSLTQVAYIIANSDKEPYGVTATFCLFAIYTSLFTIFPSGRAAAHHAFRLIKKSFLTKDKSNRIELFFLIAPFVIVVGTNQSYLLGMMKYSFFWTLCAAKLLASSSLRWQQNLVNILLAIILISQALLVLTIDYKTDPQIVKFNFKEAIESAPSDMPKLSNLTLSEMHVSLMREMIANTKNIGFKPDTPLINLTGRAPGMTYLLDARSIGHPYIVGGHSGSIDFAKEILAQSSCSDVVNAWLLLADGGYGSISVSDVPFILSDFGIKFPEDYRRMTSWHAPKGVGYGKEPMEFILYQPVAPTKCP